MHRFWCCCLVCFFTHAFPIKWLLTISSAFIYRCCINDPIAELAYAWLQVQPAGLTARWQRGWNDRKWAERTKGPCRRVPAASHRLMDLIWQAGAALVPLRTRVLIKTACFSCLPPYLTAPEWMQCSIYCSRVLFLFLAYIYVHHCDLDNIKMSKVVLNESIAQIFWF